MIFWVMSLCGALAAPATSPRAYRAAHVWNESEALGRALGAVAWLTAELENVAAPAPWAITSPAVARPLPLRAGDRYVTRWRPGQNGFVRAIDDPYPFERGHSGEKRVATSRVRVDGNDQDVVVKSMKPYRGSNGTMHLETLYLEFLRGEPGIPWLYGAYYDRGVLHTVVERAGEQLGHGTGSAWDPSSFVDGYRDLAEEDPAGVARAWIRLFRSVAERGGFVLHDFTPRQFTYARDETGAPAIYLVDAPMPHTGPMAAALSNTPQFAAEPHAAALRRRRTCRDSRDCLGVKLYHCCCADSVDAFHHRRYFATHNTSGDGGVCEPGSMGAPETHGVCGALGAEPNICAPITAKTHVFDLGGHGWILPALLNASRSRHGGRREFRDFATENRIKKALQRATRTEPADRPNFDQLLALLETSS
mmetsp:Transcript_22257/g.66716  ORF Transcript_22257/g.66716 Transcript_22257/m.66716 type:complete len:421 (-) Transcript_22257:44-1306(-)